MNKIELDAADMATCDKCGKRFDELEEGGTCRECEACICDDCTGGFADEATDYPICRDCWDDASWEYEDWEDEE